MTLRRVLTTAAIGSVLAVAALLLFGWAAGTSTRPAPDVVPGHATLSIDVAHRDEPVTLHVWYPAGDPGAPPILLGQNALFYGHYVQPDATPLPGTYPVVALSHGSGGNGVALGWLAGRLAAAGHVVVAPDHPGTMSRDSDPFRTPNVWERTGDLSAALDAVAGMALGADMGDVTAMGFSLGGHTAMALSGARVSKAAFIAYCDRFPNTIDCGWMNAAGVDFDLIDAARYEADLSDPRVTATVAVDAALPLAMTPESLSAMTAPALLLNMGRPEGIPNGMRLDAVAQTMPDATYIPLPDTWHFHMLTECSLLGRVVIGTMGDDNICSDMGLRDRAQVHDAVLDLVLPFLREH